MKRINAGYLLALFFALIGGLLLLMNLGVLGAWADVAWGGLFVVIGLLFLFWFASDRTRRWEAVAGTTLIGGGAIVLLQWQNILLGNWRLGLLLLSVAIGFWLIAIFYSEDWWAVLPAGILTVLGVLTGLQPEEFEAIFVIGLGLVFGLLFLWRRGKGDARWALVPAVALVLFGVVQWLRVDETAVFYLKWWPVLLLIGGVGIAYFTYARSKPAPKPAAVAAPKEAAPPIAPGASRTEKLPDAPAAPVAPAAPAAKPGEVDIYDLIKNQPKE
jgi:drug/metabolite transporter superfamily protein YnfA